MIDDDRLTRDSFYHGKVVIYQHRTGYRFSIDAPLLASFLGSHPEQEALEIGCGAGVIALMALYRNCFRSIVGLELQAGLADLARLNARSNRMDDRVTVIQGDFTSDFYRFKGIGHIFSNPPYMEIGRGRASSDREIRTAKFETHLQLRHILEKSAAILPRGGTLSLILPAHREEETDQIGKKNGLYLRKVREVRSFADRKAERILIQLSTSQGRLIRSTPLVVFKRNGVYSKEMETIFSGTV